MQLIRFYNMLICDIFFLLFVSQNVYSQIGRKSAQKCYEYRWIKDNDDDYRFIFPTIVGGERAQEAEFPHMAALGYGTGNYTKWMCGGSLISENFVLTAAHCVWNRVEKYVKVVRLGAINIETPGSSYKDYSISRNITHPNYKFSLQYYDIALLRLSNSVTFSSKIKPACLQIDRNFDSSTLTATGWGSTSYLSEFSSYLLKVGLVPYDINKCKRVYNNSSVRRTLPYGIQQQSMICAGGRRNMSQDTCGGDSGGPLQIFRYQYYVVGITSFGLGCGLENIPAIYTRVSLFIGWIEKTVWFTHYNN